MLELPTELWLEVIELLRPWDEGTPITGENAAWVKLNVARPPPDDPESIDVDDEPWNTARFLRTEEMDVQCALWDLRATCMAMNKLCLPYLFSTVNFLQHEPDTSVDVPFNHAKHIRFLRILVDPYLLDGELNRTYQKGIADVIEACVNLTSIAMYYRRPHTNVQTLANPITALMKAGTLESFGIYSVLVLHKDVGRPSWNRIHSLVPATILNINSTLPEGTQRLKKLDMVMETIDRNVYDTIRKNFGSLESLTFRRAITSEQGRVGSSPELGHWKPKPHLTHLRFIDCAAAYAPHIPLLVGLFPSLRYLLISTCGDYDDVVTTPRQPGWSLEKGALSNTHEPLEQFHIEHMGNWEIQALGSIPAKNVILSSIVKGDFIEALTRDPEIFPHLETLSVVQQAWDPVGEDAESYQGGELQSMKERLLKLCRLRKIEVKTDGYRIKRNSRVNSFA